MTTPSSTADLRARLAAIGQDHLLAFEPSLSPDQRRALLAQIAALDLAALPGWIDTYVKNKPAPAFDVTKIQPAPYFPNKADYSAARAHGEALLKAGKVAAFVVAGGQGSRLGYEGPKGCYPATAITKKPLFQVFAEQLLAAAKRFGKPIPWYIMTSPLNHEATVSFFKEHKYFGLGEPNVHFFPQGVMPSFDMATGKILLAARHEIATNPDGHGGAVTALHKSGALADMKQRGIEHLSYFQVDNPHVKVIDPVFLGLHAKGGQTPTGQIPSSGEMSSKMIPKAAWDEKVGVFCTVNGRLDVIEYSDIPADLAKKTGPDGKLTFAAGSIAIHIIAVAFLEKLATDPKFGLPFHRAEKKVPHVDPAGNLVSPTANNGIKLERFIFDALAMAKDSIVYETDRVEEFAPIKNATGIDSVESSQKLQTLRAARWLERCGTAIPKAASGDPDCVIELSPLTGCSCDEVACERMPKAIERGDRVVL